MLKKREPVDLLHLADGKSATMAPGMNERGNNPKGLCSFNCPFLPSLLTEPHQLSDTDTTGARSGLSTQKAQHLNRDRATTESRKAL